MRILPAASCGAFFALVLVACSDDVTPPAVDAARDRGPATTEAGAREGGKPDLPLADGKSTVDGKPVVDGKPLADSKAAVDKPTSGDLPADPCAKVTCSLKNDCCDCEAFSANVSPPPCVDTSCKQPTCGALGIQQPIPSCLKGHCLVLSDAPASCSSDKECKVVDDCCTCTALPLAAQAPACQKMCLIDTCPSWGLGAATARCLGGLCRLVP